MKKPPKVLWVNWYPDSGEVGSFNFHSKSKALEAGSPRGKPQRYVLSTPPKPKKRGRR